MIDCKEPGCRGKVEKLGHMVLHYKNEHGLMKGDWEGIKPKYEPVSDVAERPVTPEAEKEEIPSTTEPTELTGDEQERGQMVDIVWDKDKQTDMMTHRTIPAKSFKLNPMIDMMFSYLKSQGKIPRDWRMGDLINHYVLEHIKTKDGLSPSVTKTIAGNPDSKEVVMLENQLKGTENDKNKTPGQMIADMQKQDVVDAQIDKMKRKARGESEEDIKKPSGDFIDRIGKLVQQMNEQKMAERIVGKAFGGGESDNEVTVLKDRLSKMDEEKKMGELKNEISRLVDTVKTQKPTSEIGSKEIFQMMLLDKKKTDDLKDSLRGKDTEIMKQSMENQTKMLSDKLTDIKNRPNIASQIGDMQDTAKALKTAGLMGPKEDKSTAEIASDLIGGIAEKVTGSTGFQNFMSNVGKKESEYTPEQIAQIQAMEKQQQTQQQPQNQQESPHTEPPTKLGEKTIDEIAANIVQVSDQEDKIRRMKEQG